MFELWHDTIKLEAEDENMRTYLDSVFVTNNKFLRAWEGVGTLNNEDSVYTVYVPTNEVWDEMLKVSDKHFNYNLKITNPTSLTAEKRDSMRHTYARLNLIKYMTYSNYEQRYVENPDSIMPAWQGSFKHGRPEFLKDDVEKNVIFEKELSNGTFKIVDKSPYSMFDLWHDTIKLEAEDENMRTGYTGTPYIQSASKTQINKYSAFLGVKISGNRYLEIPSDRSATKVVYKVPDLLSASYKVALIVVPKNIVNADVAPEELKPYEMQIKIMQATGSKTETLADYEDVHNDPTRVDTIFLTGEYGKKSRSVVTIPYCEYYKTNKEADYGVTIEVKSDGSTKTYDRSIRLDAILFIPVEDPVE